MIGMLRSEADADMEEIRNEYMTCRGVFEAFAGINFVTKIEEDIHTEVMSFMCRSFSRMPEHQLMNLLVCLENPFTTVIDYAKAHPEHTLICADVIHAVHAIMPCQDEGLLATFFTEHLKDEIKLKLS